VLKICLSLSNPRERRSCGASTDKAKPLKGLVPASDWTQRGQTEAGKNLLDDVQDKIREVVDAVRPVRLEAADVDQGEISLGPALLSRDADLGGRRLVVELDPEGLQELLGAFPGQCALRKPLLIKRPDVLVQSAGSFSARIGQSGCFLGLAPASTSTAAGAPGFVWGSISAALARG